MSFATSRKVFESLFLDESRSSPLIQEFKKNILSYLWTRRSLSEAKVLYTWIANGKGLNAFMCQPQAARRLSKKMIDEGIPHVAVTDDIGRIGFVIRSCDGEGTDVLCKQVLQELSHYCRQLTMAELKQEIRNSKSMDQNILYLSGLNKGQIDTLLTLCNAYFDGEPVSVDLMGDGTYMFGIQGKIAMKKQYEQSVLFCTLFMQAMLESEGFLKEENNRIVANQRMVERAAANNFVRPDKKDVWILGKRPYYLHVTNDGFEYGKAVEEAGSIILQEIYRCHKMLPEYTAELQSYFGFFDNPGMTTDRRLALDFLSGKSNQFDFSRKDDIGLVHSFKHDLAKRTMQIVMTAMRSEQVMVAKQHWNEKFDYIMRQSSEYLSAVRAATREVLILMSTKNLTYEEAVAEIENDQAQNPPLREPYAIPSKFTLDDIKAGMEVCGQYQIALEQDIEVFDKLRHLEISIGEPDRLIIEDVAKPAPEIRRGDRERDEREPDREPKMVARAVPDFRDDEINMNYEPGWDNYSSPSREWDSHSHDIGVDGR